MNIKTILTVSLSLGTVILLGCNQPSVPTPTGMTLVNTELTSLLDEDVRQRLSTMTPQKHVQSIAICPEDLAEINVTIDSVQNDQSKSVYLTNIEMSVTQNEGFQIEVGNQGNPTNLGNRNTIVMALPYLVTCSKVSYFRESLSQSQIVIYADGRIDVFR